MKKIILFFAITSGVVACKNNQAKTESATTDSVVTSRQATKQPVVVQKEVHYVNTSNNAVQAEHKKGWSSAAKGTAIGAGTGAVVGAVVSKKHGKGAIIGGVVGAGAGYLIGKHHDKKKKRRQYQK